MTATTSAEAIEETTAGLDERALRRGIERGDVEALMGLYTVDATIEVVDQTTPPSTPRVLRGRAEIRRFHDDISCRDMEHRLDQVVLGTDAAAYLERCEYPGGPRVVVVSTIELRGRSIVRQVLVQSWDV